MFLDYNSQKSWLAQLVLNTAGNFNPRTPGDPKLGTTVLEHFLKIQAASFPTNALGYQKILCCTGGNLDTLMNHRVTLQVLSHSNTVAPGTLVTTTKTHCSLLRCVGIKVVPAPQFELRISVK